MLSYNHLSGTKVKLVRIKEEDIPTITAWHEDQEFLRNLDALPAFPKQSSSFKEWVDSKNDKEYVLGIKEIETNQLVGYISFDGILWPHRTTWVALAIGGKENRSRGLGTEAMQLGLQFAFHELNLYRVQLSVFDYNKRAMALYEKLGFKQEGRFREFLERDGKRYDMNLYGLLRHEWEERNLH